MATHVYSQVNIHSFVFTQPVSPEFTSYQPPSALTNFLERTLYRAALSDLRVVLSNLAKLKATRVTKAFVAFLSRHEQFSFLLHRLTKNYWIALTEEEKAFRFAQRNKSILLQEERKLQYPAQIREAIASKFYLAHKFHRPIRLSRVELTWLERNQACLSLFNLKAGFILPSVSAPFDFSDKAYETLATRLRYGMLTPSDIATLVSYHVPISCDGIVSLDDSKWIRDPYAKAVLYHLVKFRREEMSFNENCSSVECAQAEQTLNQSVFYKRVSLSCEEFTQADSFISPKPASIMVAPATTTSNGARIDASFNHNPASLKRIELTTEEPTEIYAFGDILETTWVDKLKLRLSLLLGFQEKERSFSW